MHPICYQDQATMAASSSMVPPSNVDPWAAAAAAKRQHEGTPAQEAKEKLQERSKAIQKEFNQLHAEAAQLQAEGVQPKQEPVEHNIATPAGMGTQQQHEMGFDSILIPRYPIQEVALEAMTRVIFDKNVATIDANLTWTFEPSAGIHLKIQHGKEVDTTAHLQKKSQQQKST